MIIFDKKTVTRRSVLQRAVAAGAVASVGPWFVRDARSSSGELNWFTWEDYAPKALMDKFTKDTGIKINVTLFDSNETQLNKLRAARGESQKPSREIFYRCAKALLQAGGSGSEGFDRALGLTLSATKVKIHRARLRLARARLTPRRTENPR